MTQLSLPQSIQFVLHALTSQGFSAFVVGGCVRDALLGRTPNDWDVTTSALPEQTLQVFAEFPTIEVGKAHGTIGVILDGEVVEITTFRTETDYKDHRHPDTVSFTPSLQEDLSRRDFTINALAYHPEVGLVDRVQGVRDLQARVIRVVGDPALRFEEDALRILRGMRFGAQLGFSIAPETAKAMLEKKELLSYVSVERIFSELRKLLCAPFAAQILRKFSPILFFLMPELAPMAGFLQHTPYHCYDVWEHTLHAIEATPSDLCLRLTMLLHDCGKPHTYTQDADGVGHFPKHAEQSVLLAEQILERYRAEKKLLRQVLLLIEHHDIVLLAEEKWMRRQCNRFGIPTVRQLLAIHRSDTLAQSAICQPRLETIARCEAILEQIEQQSLCFQLRDLAVNGTTLQHWGIPKGKQIGQVLQRLLQAVIEGQCSNTERALYAYWSAMASAKRQQEKP